MPDMSTTAIPDNSSREWTPMPNPTPDMIDDRAVEAAARALYELDPFHEGGEYVDGHCVSPGGNLTWEQACARDAEFVDVTFMLPVTQPAREAARAALHAAAPFLTQIPDAMRRYQVVSMRATYDDGRVVDLDPKTGLPPPTEKNDG